MNLKKLEKLIAFAFFFVFFYSINYRRSTGQLKLISYTHRGVVRNCITDYINIVIHKYTF